MCFIWKQNISNNTASTWNDLLNSSHFSVRLMCVQQVKKVSTGTSHTAGGVQQPHVASTWDCTALTKMVTFLHASFPSCHHSKTLFILHTRIMEKNDLHEFMKSMCQWHFTPWHSNNNSWLKYKSPYWQLLVLELRALMCFKRRSQVSHSPYTLKHLHLYIWQKCACILAGSLRVQTFTCLGHAM